MRFTSLAAVVLLLAAAGVRADEPAYPSHAEDAYRRYCASCHGIDGRGHGPVADSLKLRPTDLTRSDLPLGELMRVIDGRRTVRAHGTSAMPVWGKVFEETAPYPERKVRQALREVQALAEYTRALQVNPSPK
jgi:mono/diheme cytochrome c family protein